MARFGLDCPTMEIVASANKTRALARGGGYVVGPNEIGTGTIDLFMLVVARLTVPENVCA